MARVIEYLLVTAFALGTTYLVVAPIVQHTADSLNQSAELINSAMKE